MGIKIPEWDSVKHGTRRVGGWLWVICVGALALMCGNPEQLDWPEMTAAIAIPLVVTLAALSAGLNLVDRHWPRGRAAFAVIPTALLIGGFLEWRAILVLLPPPVPRLALRSTTGDGRPITSADVGSRDRRLTIQNMHTASIRDVVIYVQMPERILSSWIARGPELSQSSVAPPEQHPVLGDAVTPSATGSGSVERICDPFETVVEIKIASLSPEMAVDVVMRTRGTAAPELPPGAGLTPYFAEGSFRYDNRRQRPPVIFRTPIIQTGRDPELGETAVTVNHLSLPLSTHRCRRRVSSGTTANSSAGITLGRLAR
jgi:hypothetical protein